MTPAMWAIYIRVSTRHQAKEGFSLQDQRERLTAYAAERGWSYRVFEDAGESGSPTEERARRPFPGQRLILKKRSSQPKRHSEFQYP